MGLEIRPAREEEWDEFKHVVSVTLTTPEVSRVPPKFTLCAFEDDKLATAMWNGLSPSGPTLRKASLPSRSLITSAHGIRAGGNWRLPLRGVPSVVLVKRHSWSCQSALWP